MASANAYFFDNAAYKLKLYRVNRCWSLTTAGIAAGGIEATAVSRIEGGVHTGNMTCYLKMVEGYGLPYGEVFRHYDSPVPKECWKVLNCRAQKLGAELRTKIKQRKKNGERVDGLGKQLELF